jgi:hypothetical protein
MAVDAVTPNRRWRVRHARRVRHDLLSFVLLAAGALQASEVFTEGEILSAGCGGCHGHTGVSATSSMPSIAGFGRQPNRMREALLALSDAEVLAITHFLASRD